jgi:hypothetical protein
MPTDRPITFQGGLGLQLLRKVVPGALTKARMVIRLYVAGAFNEASSSLKLIASWRPSPGPPL